MSEFGCEVPLSDARLFSMIPSIIGWLCNKILTASFLLSYHVTFLYLSLSGIFSLRVAKVQCEGGKEDLDKSQWRPRALAARVCSLLWVKNGTKRLFVSSFSHYFQESHRCGWLVIAFF